MAKKATDTEKAEAEAEPVTVLWLGQVDHLIYLHAGLGSTERKVQFLNGLFEADTETHAALTKYAEAFPGTIRPANEVSNG